MNIANTQSFCIFATKIIDNMTMKKYPIGIQTFEKLRNEGYLYIDKTAQIMKMVQEGNYYSLSRPRRFGKSLLLSTIQAYFEGKRELFKGLAIDTDEMSWDVHPVLRFDLNAEKYDSKESLELICLASLIKRLKKDFSNSLFLTIAV